MIVQDIIYGGARLVYKDYNLDTKGSFGILLDW